MLIQFFRTAAGGFLDHGIFLVKNSCTSLRKGTELKIVNTLPLNDDEWMAVVIIEEKVNMGIPVSRA